MNFRAVVLAVAWPAPAVLAALGFAVAALLALSVVLLLRRVRRARSLRPAGPELLASPYLAPAPLPPPAPAPAASPPPTAAPPPDEASAPPPLDAAARAVPPAARSPAESRRPVPAAVIVPALSTPGPARDRGMMSLPSGAREVLGPVPLRDLLASWRCTLRRLGRGQNGEALAFEALLGEVEAALLPAAPEPVPVALALSEVLGAVRFAPGVSVRRVGNPGAALAPPRALRLLLRLVLLEAAGAMPSGGFLALRGAREEGWARLEVADSGGDATPGFELLLATRLAEALGGSLQREVTAGKGAVSRLALRGAPREGRRETASP